MEGGFEFDLAKVGRLLASALSRSTDFDYVPNNVADAFYRRGWLVELVFAQERYVVSVYTHEALDDHDAYKAALARAREYRDNLGNLLRSQVLRDQDSNREFLRVDGSEFAVKVEYGINWRDAA